MVIGGAYPRGRSPTFEVSRREFMTRLGGAAAASAVSWPRAARAQQRGVPVIGFLHSQSAAPFSHMVAAFRRGLHDAGFLEGQNIAIEYRWAEGRYDRLPALASDLIRQGPAVLVATGGGAPAAGPETRTPALP